MTRIRFLRKAEEEVRVAAVAAQFYEEAQPGLGRALIDEVLVSVSDVNDERKILPVVR